MSRLSSLVKRYPLVTFFGLIFLLEWVLIAPLTTTEPKAVGLIAFLPTPAAIMVAALADGKLGLRDLLRRIREWRVGFVWYLAAMGLPFLIHLIAALISLLLGSRLAIPIEQFVPLAIAILILATGEEIGWRGFAFPKLLNQHPPLTASIIFGILHALFHLPMYLLPLPEELRQASPFWLFLLMIIAFAIFSFWLYLHTRGSVIIGVVNHTFINLSALLVSGTPKETMGWLLPGVWIVAAVTLVLTVGVTLSRPQGRLHKPQLAAP